MRNAECGRALCVYVCVRERERQTDRQRGRERKIERERKKEREMSNMVAPVQCSRMVIDFISLF
jgi:hypothetical protein